MLTPIQHQSSWTEFAGVPFVDSKQETVALPTWAFFVDSEGCALNEPVQVSGQVFVRQIHRQRSPEMHKKVLTSNKYGDVTSITEYCKNLQKLLQGH